MNDLLKAIIVEVVSGVIVAKLINSRIGVVKGTR